MKTIQAFIQFRSPACARGIAIVMMVSSIATLLAQEKGKDYKPVINPKDFSTKITNPYFPLTPGTTLTYVEKSGRETVEITSAVTKDSRIVMGVKCVVVHETVKLDGKLKEDTYDWYAQHTDGSVWYFGEDTKEFLPGGRVKTEGSWEAGVRGALPGIVMPGELKVGHRYRQEYLKDEAEDMAEITALNDAATVPAGDYKPCVQTRDWSMLETGSTKKWYAKGVGFVREVTSAGDTCTLVSITKN